MVEPAEPDGTRKLRPGVRCSECNSPAHHVHCEDWGNEHVTRVYHPCGCKVYPRRLTLWENQERELIEEI